MKITKAIIVILFMCSLAPILELTDSISVIAKDFALAFVWIIIAKWMMERWFPQRCMWLEKNNDQL